MKRVPKTGSYFVVGTASLPLSACKDIAGVWTLCIARQPNLRFDWRRAAPPPIELTALDAEQSPLWIHTFVAGHPDTCCLALDLDDVRGHLLAVQSSLASLRMHFADGSIESLAVRLEPKGLTEIAIE